MIHGHKDYILFNGRFTISEPEKPSELVRLVMYDNEMTPHYLMGKEYNALKKQGIVEELFWVKEGPYWGGLLECHLIKHSKEKEVASLWEKRLVYKKEYGALYGNTFYTPSGIEDASYEEWLKNKINGVDENETFYNFFNIFYKIKDVISDFVIGIQPLLGKEPTTFRNPDCLYKAPYEGLLVPHIYAASNRIEADLKIDGKRYKVTGQSIEDIYREIDNLKKN